MFIIKQL